MSEASPGGDIDGYVGDTRYPSKFHQQIQPPWIDAVLLLNGIAPPRTGAAPFKLVDLGCGDGIGLVLAAASHPQATFVGVDAMPAHVARGQALIAQLGLRNITLHCAGFADCMDLANGSADYVTAHGVLAWISDANRQALIALSSQWLRPGGAFAVSYNAFPGWSPVAPFQAIVRAAALGLSGSSSERFDQAFAMLRHQGLIAEAVWTWLENLQGQVGETYFAHEYLNAHWRPCWSGEVIAALADHGLAFVGQLSSGRLRVDLTLKAQWRATIDQLPTVPAREIAADLLAECWFRRDLYLKLPALAFESPAELLAARLQTWWGTAPGLAEEVGMRTDTAAGEVTFDNAAALALRSSLAAGPARLADVAAQHGLAGADVLNTCDAMWIAGQVLPLDARSVGTQPSSVNAAIAAAGIGINGLATPHGAQSAG